MGSRNSSQLNIVGRAIIPTTSPSDVVIVPSSAPTVAPIASRSLVNGVAIARVNRPELTDWLCEAINRRLAGLPPHRPRPRGLLLERGAFAQVDDDVVAVDWYGCRRQITVAHCGAVDPARALAEQLNHLLIGT